MWKLAPRPRALAKVLLATTMLGALTRGGVSYPGGLDLTTPALALQNGAVRDGVNFEVMLTGGYGRIAGYERFDGQDSPSDASWILVQVVSFTNVPAVGDSISQASSGATATVAAVNATPPYMVVTEVSGSFDDSGAITVGATPIGTATPLTADPTVQQQAQYTNAAADIYRALIGEVPGSGAILGVVCATFDDVDYVYAFRNNVGGTAADLYVSSGSGWVQVPFFDTVEFDTGNGGPPLDGATLTQGGVTATVKRVMTREGDLWTGSAEGAFVITNIAGGNFAAGAATLTGGATVNLLGAQTAITMQPNGRFQFDRGNFGGQETTARIYGCDNVNKAFEFDGETLAPITTGLPVDAPTNIQVHANHLFLTYDASLLFSAPGNPFEIAGELAAGSNVTALKTLPGAQTTASMGVWGMNGTSILYGTSEDDWNLVSLNTTNGAHRYSVQDLFDCFTFDDLGITTLQATLNFGNFASGTLTNQILPFIQQNRTRVSASNIQRTKGQYRTFFSNGYGLYMTISNQTCLGSIPVFFPNPVNVIDSFTTSEGDEVCYFGSSDDEGYVYQLDKGSSFDGADLDAYITLAWDFLKSPRVVKHFHRASVEIQGDSWVSVQFGYQLGYGSALINQPTTVSYSSDFSPAPMWDVFTWDEFVWDGETLTPTTADLPGDAENIQVTISSGTDYILPFTVNSVVYQYEIRRQLR